MELVGERLAKVETVVETHDKSIGDLNTLVRSIEKDRNVTLGVVMTVNAVAAILVQIVINMLKR